MWTISLPLKVPISKKKFFHLNLNQYRNAHHFTLDRAKKEFTKLMKGKLRGIPELKMLTLEYILYPGTTQLCDTNNICSIADKFFSDTLVAMKVISDDNYKFLIDTRFRFGHIDRKNPRVDVIIRSPDHIPLVPPEIVHESKAMKIKTKTVVLLSMSDVTEALKSFLETKISLSPDADFTVTGDGAEFRIEIEQETVTTEQSESKPRSRRKVDRMEPKEAMAALVKSTEKETKTQPVETEPVPVVAEEKGHVEDAAPTKPTKPLFGFKTVTPEPVPSPVEEAAPEPAQAPPTKAPSLFSAFKRPSN